MTAAVITWNDASNVGIGTTGPVAKLDIAQREGNFREVELGLDETAAQAEAKRCLRCDLEWLDRLGIPRPTAEPVTSEEMP